MAAIPVRGGEPDFSPETPRSTSAVPRRSQPIAPRAVSSLHRRRPRQRRGARHGRLGPWQSRGVTAEGVAFVGSRRLLSTGPGSASSSRASVPWPPTETPAPPLKRRRMAADKARRRVLPASPGPPLRGPPARFRSTASDCSAVCLSGARWRRVARLGPGGRRARGRGSVVPRCAAAEPPAGPWPVG